MYKELEALNYVWYNYYTEELSQDEVEQIEKHLNIVQDGLKRLEAIDNSNPSEALECLENLCDEFPILKKDYKIINKALIKAQEQKKILEIIKEKTVNILLLELAENVDEYNERIIPNGKLTQEEFDLLKRYLDNEH